YLLYILGFRRLFSPVGSVCTIQIYTKRRGYPLGVASHKPVNLKLFFDGCLRHINISLIFNSLISQCNPGVSEYLFNIDLIEFSTLRRRLAPLQYIINNQKLTLLL
ncbi:hypothetical protein, partial [Bacteroides fragilis]|uniref:hypothetical protein n=1 Tax=Bacteroides fragilis TaxID=817 RepID=UPI0032EE0AB5